MISDDDIWFMFNDSILLYLIDLWCNVLL